MSRARWSALAAVVAGLLVTVPDARAATVGLASVGTFAEPTYVTAAPGDASRIYVVERRGTIKVVRDGVPATFADLSGLVGGTDGERGLLSVAFAPDFAASRRFYAYYTAKGSGDITIARFVARDADGAAGTPEVLVSIPHDRQSNHNGGQLQFGPDGLLYAGTGDGGAGDDQAGNGQYLTAAAPSVVNGVNHDARLGKLLRLDVSPAQGYAAPPGNAFGPPDKAGEIYAYGLRNPYRFSFDGGTGDLVIGDVGQNAREEVDLLPAGSPAGANFGWSRWEGTLNPSGAPRTGFTFPVLEYGHGGKSFGGLEGCSVTGGYVVRDPNLPELLGQYVFADYCTQGIRVARLPAAGTAGTKLDLTGFNQTNVISFGEDACGRVYVATQDGAVSRLTSGGGCTLRPVRGAGGSAPPPSAPPVSSAPPADVRAPIIKLRNRRAQRAIAYHRVRLAVSCDELCDLRAGGQFLIGAAKPAKRPRLPIRTRRGRLDAKARVTLDLRASPRTQRVVAAALRRKRKVVARIELRVTDTAGNVRTTAVRIRIRR